jgi:branched-chain amino acid transport system permease protein
MSAVLSSGTGRRTRRVGWAGWAVPLLMLLLAAVPVYAGLAADPYALTLSSRILVFALAAVGLNIALGYGGMVSMGHAMYLGLGAFGVAILNGAGIHSGWLQLPAIGLMVAAVSALVGWMALRTRGIAFIMITLAFAQLFFFLFVGLKAYGGDEGMSLERVGSFARLAANPAALYYALLACLGVVMYGVRRMMASRFGLVLRAARVNERRVAAVGIAVLPYRLTAYVLSALVCAMAGFFLAHLTGFVSPAYLAWTVSGELIVMVVLGGVATVAGPVAGALALLLVEEGLKSWTEHWPLVLGALIVWMVLSLRGGLWGLLGAAAADEDRADPGDPP